ncbi:MAG: hypothetical protein JNL98_12740 [Bryobacterales bacterium]|nr:hypothetical protein [Bryobacterales bacterium]
MEHEGHFELHDWIDFVRRAGPPDRLALMERHYKTGCERCCQMVATLSEAYGAAQELSRIRVPDSVVSRAKAIFSRAPAEPLWGSLKQLFATLLPGPEPALVGVRSQSVGAVPKVYEVGAFQVHLRDEETGEGDRVLVGQISAPGDPDFSPAGRTVFLIHGRQILARTTTAPSGEFQMQFPPRKKLRLAIPLESSGVRLEIGLEPPADESL